ncbi:MAG: hypothetical protein QOE55_8170 [Acidobacteriaceae bacterium]|nr:hypothetical protein [Acidobacteriaceae bacterium]
MLHICACCCMFVMLLHNILECFSSRGDHVRKDSHARGTAEGDPGSVSERMVGFWQRTWLRSFKPPKTRFAVFCAIWQLRDYARVSMGAP